MKIISMTAIAAVTALSVVAFGATGTAKAGPIVPPDMTVSNMPKAGRIAASRATRSVRRPLRASPPNAMHPQFAMMSIGDGKAEVSASSSYQILTPASNSKKKPSPSVRPPRARRGRAVHSCLSGQMISNRPPWPEWITRRKPCNFTIAATRFRPRPTPGVLRILSER